MAGVLGKLATAVATTRPDLLARPVLDALRSWPPGAPVSADQVLVAPIDPAYADTAQLCAAYDVPLAAAANCVVVVGRRAGQVHYAACLVLATTRVDVNTVVRRHLDVRKASFAPMADAVGLTGMEYGGITPVGLPEGWPLLIDPAVVAVDLVVVGSGVRHSKVAVPGAAMVALPAATVLPGLGIEVSSASQHRP